MGSARLCLLCAGAGDGEVELCVRQREVWSSFYISFQLVSVTHSFEGGISSDVMRDNNNYGTENLFANDGFKEEKTHFSVKNKIMCRTFIWYTGFHCFSM